MATQNTTSEVAFEKETRFFHSGKDPSGMEIKTKLTMHPQPNCTFSYSQNTPSAEQPGGEARQAA
jgi:hypothetical protein